ncbi:MAG: beta-N-acetylhexosaminidase [Glaciihabitans sp.]|nr:beta-N-acetylhexosaminidase [Glaciihabitans sp.]
MTLRPGPEVAEPALGVLLAAFAGPALPESIAARLRLGLAGVCLFASNIESREQLRGLTTAIRRANPLALIAIDEEGGDVTRLYSDQGSPYPGNALLGRADDPAATEAVARAVGLELRSVGVNLDFAPDVDINSNPDNPVIGTRSFGTDPKAVARHTAAWVQGLQSTGVAASAKHFPGHGDTAMDSHLSVPVVDRSLAELRERELVPFVAAIAAGSATIMTSHILLPQLDANHPATLSPVVLRGLLRGELGYDGVIVSDALDMVGASGEIGIPEAAVRAVLAGCDLLCVGSGDMDEILTATQAALDAAVASGRLDAALLDTAADRNRALAAALLAPLDQEQPGPVPLDVDRAIAAFDITGTPTIEQAHTVVAIETESNIAVGDSPWGLAAAGLEVIVLQEGEKPPQGGQLILVGKNNHRHAWVRALVDEERQRHPSTVVIDMGWPGDDRRYADVATFGASRYVGLALRHWLEQAYPPHQPQQKVQK